MAPSALVWKDEEGVVRFELLKIESEIYSLFGGANMFVDPFLETQK